MISYWEKSDWFPHYDYCIVGAGLVGLVSSILLKEALPEKQIAIIERSPLPQGASTKNAGFACYGTAGEILDDLENMPLNEVLETLQLRWDGLQQLKAMFTAASIDYLPCGGVELFHNAERYDHCLSKLDDVNKLLEQVTGYKDTLKQQASDSKFLFHKDCLYNPNEGKLHPVKLVKKLITKSRSLGVDIHFGMKLSEFGDYEGGQELVLNDGMLSLHAEHLILTTNAFTKSLCPHLDIIAARNQVLVTDELPELALDKTYHYDRGYIYFRKTGNRLLLGGARNVDPDTELTTHFGGNEQVLTHLKAFMENNLKVSPDRITHQWSGIIATGKTKRPIIQRVSDSVYVAARLGGMGVATGSAVAKKLILKLLENS